MDVCLAKNNAQGHVPSGRSPSPTTNHRSAHEMRINQGGQQLVLWLWLLMKNEAEIIIKKDGRKTTFGWQPAERKCKCQVNCDARRVLFFSHLATETFPGPGPGPVQLGKASTPKNPYSRPGLFVHTRRWICLLRCFIMRSASKVCSPLAPLSPTTFSPCSLLLLQRDFCFAWPGPKCCACDYAAKSFEAPPFCIAKRGQLKLGCSRVILAEQLPALKKYPFRFDIIGSQLCLYRAESYSTLFRIKMV